MGHTFHGVQVLPAAALNVPAGHGEHARSDEAVGACVSYSPAPHSRIAEQTRSALALGATLVYCPTGHMALCSLQVRSELAVGAAPSYCALVHCVTARQGVPSCAAEYMSPPKHGAHSRSPPAEPPATIPWPTPHTRHGVQETRPWVAVKVPLAQSAQVRSLEVVAGVTVYVPTPHAGLTELQGAALPPTANDVPKTHAVHWRALSADPATDTPKPAAHVAHGTHALRPAASEYVPAGHATQARSLVAVAKAVV